MTDISKLAKAIGYKRIAEGVGVSDQMVYNRVSIGTFPASWFAVISDLSAALDLGIPDRATFNFKTSMLCKDSPPAVPHDQNTPLIFDQQQAASAVRRLGNLSRKDGA